MNYVLDCDASNHRNRPHPAGHPDCFGGMIGGVGLDVLRVHEHRERSREPCGPNGAHTATHHLSVDTEVRDLIGNRCISVSPHALVAEVIRTGNQEQRQSRERHIMVRFMLLFLSFPRSYWTSAFITSGSTDASFN